MKRTDEQVGLAGHEIAQLVVRAQAGEIQAFERLIAVHQARVYSFARGFTQGDVEMASDLAQEALIKVYRSIGGFRFQSSFSTWLFRIVKNVFLDYKKSRRETEHRAEQRLSEAQADRLTEEDAADAEAQLLRREEHAELWQALARVPEAYRTVLILAEIQGQSYEEIAAVVEAPLGTVKSRLKRGRDALRDALVALRARRDKGDESD